MPPLLGPPSPPPPPPPPQVPGIDLLNHSPDARPPMLQLDDADRLVATALPTAGGAAAPLGAGEELTISYGARAPADGWLKFGFVSREWWRRARGDGEEDGEEEE
jgi:hypothetical protein